jgi:hypothetical protein
LSTTTGPNGTLVRTPFQGNVIPLSRLDPVAVKVLSYIPNGNVVGNSITGLNNLANDSNSHKFTDFFPEHTARVDYNLTPTTQLFVRYSRNALQEERNFKYSTTSKINPADTGTNNPFTRENHNATIQVTKVLSPTLVFNVRLGLERFKALNGSEQGNGVGPSTLGFSPTFVSQAANWFPKFNWANYEGAGTQPSWVSPLAQTNTLQTSLAKTSGIHSFNMGGDFRLLRGYAVNPGWNAGNFSFDQGFTGANPLAIQPSSGNSIASFLLGTPASGYIQVNTMPARQEKMASLYLQDDIRVTSRLKINAGLRWDYMGSLTDRFDALARGFDPNVLSPLQPPGLTLHGGLLFAGVNGQPRNIFDPNWHNFGPRAGAAYRLDQHTVLRGGYALVYGQTWYDPGNAPGFSQNTNMVTSIQAGVPYNTLDNAFPTGILTPVGSSLGLMTSVGQGLVFADPAGGSAPYVHQFSFEVQRSLPGDFLLTGAYVGSRSRRIAVTQQLNALPLSAFQLGAAALSASVANPMAGMVPQAPGINGANVQQQQLLVPFPQFPVNGVTKQDVPIGTSNYDALQLLVTKRVSRGLNFSAAYTYSKQLDQTSYANPQDTRLEKVVASWDVPQSLQINLVYDLPFGNGKRFGSGLPKPVRYAVSNWSFSSLTRLTQGMPMSFPANAVPTGVNPAVADPNYNRWFNTCTQLANGQRSNCASATEDVAWTIRQPFTLQTWSSRLASVRLPGVHNVDISVMKNIQITERFGLIFRTDFINALNSAQFYNGPVTDATNGNFGRIAGATTQSNLPRFIQFSLKLQF